MEVVSCGITCAAHISDKLTCLDIVAYLCGKLCLMGIYGNISVVILDNDAVSVAAVPACACIGNCSACGSVNGRAIGSCYVDALVVSSVALVGGDISAVNRPYIFARTACGDELGSVVGNIGSLCCAYSDYLGNRLLNNNRINGLFPDNGIVSVCNKLSGKLLAVTTLCLDYGLSLGKLGIFDGDGLVGDGASESLLLVALYLEIGNLRLDLDKSSYPENAVSRSSMTCPLYVA